MDTVSILIIMKTVSDFRGFIIDCLLLRKEAAARHRLARTEKPSPVANRTKGSSADMIFEASKKTKSEVWKCFGYHADAEEKVVVNKVN